MTPRRRICVFTGSRAEYGLLYWLMREIQGHPELELQTLVSGTHLSPEFGSTWKSIAEDGFLIDSTVEMILSSDTPRSIAASVGLATIRYADALSQLKPDILVVLGDRFETLAIAQAALFLQIPLAHIHGGEVTAGAFDEAIRHSVTKMAHLHFTTAEPYRQRVIQLGEKPSAVFNVGAPAVDNLTRSTLLSRSDLSVLLDFPLDEPVLLVTYHPVTLGSTDPAQPMGQLLAALELFSDTRIVITKANADTAGRIINEMADGFASTRRDRALSIASLGRIPYLSLLCLAAVVVGNSSSGIIEGPAAGRATVNIGARQDGRLRCASIIDCAETCDEIAMAITRALAPEFQRQAAAVRSPYGAGRAAARMVEILAGARLESIVVKRFHDLPTAGSIEPATLGGTV
jgi:UDP-hydrolysing UDP-N-acetyl-D-glucosamine 2-epimerase